MQFITLALRLFCVAYFVTAQGDIDALKESVGTLFDFLHHSFRDSRQHFSPREICQFGLGPNSVKLSKHWLSLFPEAILHLFDVTGIDFLLELKQEFPDRVFFGIDYVRWEEEKRRINCSLVLFSIEGPLFTLERVMDNIHGEYVTMVFISHDCYEKTEHDGKRDTGAIVMKGQCAYLSTFWNKTKLMWRGKCAHDMCMSIIRKVELEEPNVVQLDCDLFEKPPSLGTPQDFMKATSEYAQDWFLHYNFFRAGANDYASYLQRNYTFRNCHPRYQAGDLVLSGMLESSAEAMPGRSSACEVIHRPVEAQRAVTTGQSADEIASATLRSVALSEDEIQKRRVYVDIGGCLPFDYSNTVYFDRCQRETWEEGLCVEPNSQLTPFLRGYRRCKVLELCVAEKEKPRTTFRYRDGDSAFVTSCTTLANILVGSNIYEIDFLNVDVENQEKRIFMDFPFQAFDIKHVVVEVNRGVNWLELDTLFLKNGYIKVAILGRDAVYSKIKALQQGKGHLPGFELLNKLPSNAVHLPQSWNDFHYRVISDETKYEEYMQARIRREVLLKKIGWSEKDAGIEAKRQVDEVWAAGTQQQGGYMPDEDISLYVESEQ